MSAVRSPLNVRIAAVLAVLGLVLHAGLSLLPHATAAGPDGELVEICTSGGIRLVAAGPDGLPAGSGGDGPVVVDCPVCLAKTLVLVAAFAAAGLLLVSGPGGGAAPRRPDDPRTGGGADERPPARAPPAAA
jgi:hypothetical protein